MEYNSDEYDEAETSKPRLNMSHGFIHHIRRNQVDRDNYDKKLKSTKGKTKTSGQSSKSPQHKLYVPPNHRKSTDEEPTLGKPLFKLEYTDRQGQVHPVVVRSTDNARVIAERLQRNARIPPKFLDTLEWKIEQEQMKHGD
uniref:UPF0561 protein C2orf68 homolog n=1 Tax=Phallusia mammillata TaxID=59560 RepID=A0A6F9D7V8_9ASCI|nr:UPF0561 protein C2orf68 homolog [Phallusia mammillata]